MLSRRRFLARASAAAAVSATGLAGLGYTVYVEPFWLETVRRSMPVKNLPSHLEGRTLVQLSDIHVGPWVNDRYLLNVFEHVRSLDPDYLVVTGDFVSHYDGIVDHAARVYPSMPEGRLGTFGIFGNHDYGEASADSRLASELHGIFEQAGMTILQNESVDAEGLRIVGLDDAWGPFFDPARVMATVGAGEPAVVLSHNPDTCDLPIWGDFDGWILSGHTHGGQCKAPLFPPPILPVQNKRYIEGAFDLSGNRSLYINRGIGHQYQLRFNARPEITVFSLTREA